MGVAVYKFGGASVKNGQAIKEMLEIVDSSELPLLVVVSAIGKTTNALEGVCALVKEGRVEDAKEAINEILDKHWEIAGELELSELEFESVTGDVSGWISEHAEELQHMPFDQAYDQIVSLGEVWSTRLIAKYAEKRGLKNEWWDARRLIYTNSKFRNGELDWINTDLAIQEKWMNKKSDVVFSQGFIGGDPFGKTTTLGREGSDYSGAIFAYCLGAESYTIWKDVPGLMTGDPKVFDDVSKIDHISYSEAIELSYYGASVIHPKTLAPLKKRGIGLRVKSFVNPTDSGTVINDEKAIQLPTSQILKKNQVLVTLSPKDFSILSDAKISEVLGKLDESGMRSNLLEVNALSLSICFDFDRWRLPDFVNLVESQYHVKYNLNLNLLTVRYPESNSLPKTIQGKSVVLEQRNRVTSRWVFIEQE